MEPADVKMVHDDQDTAAKSTVSRAAFLRDYRQVAADIRAKAAGPPHAAKGKGKGKAKAAAPPLVRVPVDSTIPHDQAARLMPPGASIWQGRKQQAWCVHVPPRPRISEPWGLDVSKALMRVAYRAWVLHLDLHSLDWPACPHIFPEWC